MENSQEFNPFKVMMAVEGGEPNNPFAPVSTAEIKDDASRMNRWYQKRVGKITSSNLPTLMCKGRRDMTEEEILIRDKEYEEAKARGEKVRKPTRTTIDAEFGEVAITYLYGVRREILTGVMIPAGEAKAFEWGHTHEPNAIQWLKTNFNKNVLSCSDDFDEIMFNEPFPGFGDSPDGMLDNGNEKYTIEIKCPISQPKIEKIKEMTRDEAKAEYLYQFCGHFLGDSTRNKLIYFVYDGHNISDFRPADEVSRGTMFVYDRSEFEKDIKAVEEKVKFCVQYLNSPNKIRDING